MARPKYLAQSPEAMESVRRRMELEGMRANGYWRYNSEVNDCARDHRICLVICMIVYAALDQHSLVVNPSNGRSDMWHYLTSYWLRVEYQESRRLSVEVA